MISRKAWKRALMLTNAMFGVRHFYFCKMRRKEDKLKNSKGFCDIKRWNGVNDLCHLRDSLHSSSHSFHWVLCHPNVQSTWILKGIRLVMKF